MNLNDIILEIGLIHPYIFNLTYDLGSDRRRQGGGRRTLVENPLSTISGTLGPEEGPDAPILHFPQCNSQDDSSALFSAPLDVEIVLRRKRSSSLFCLEPFWGFSSSFSVLWC